MDLPNFRKDRTFLPFVKASFEKRDERKLLWMEQGHSLLLKIMMFEDLMQAELDRLESEDLLRTIVPKKQCGTKIEFEDCEYCDLASNDYLGLGQDAKLNAEFTALLAQRPISFSSSGSPLLTGAHGSYQEATRAVEDLFPSKKCLFFNSGFAANSGVIAALGQMKGTLILADKLSHASVIDGICSSRSVKALRFTHNDMEALERTIKQYESEYDRILVVTEAVFSMDGDRAPLQEMAALKKRHAKVALYVDEAHSFGVFGDEGRGACAACRILDNVDFILCTCGKALGSEGAFLLCSETARSYLINKVRPLIFSTAISPAAFAHIAFMIRKMRSCDDRRRRLQMLADRVRSAVSSEGNINASSTQIIPFLTYDNERAVHACRYFKERGLYVMPIRHPTVPKGTARLRISLSAALSDEECDKLCAVIKEYATLYLGDRT